ncbi:hypothetical protein [Helicobacter equorum]|uniref:hypothetical protein n=1 Tax=Helicobacter equorum TaxID=361872 RepID=UPI000CF0E02D|nr:hypothetical protein [Helicobacter equorum]
MSKESIARNNNVVLLLAKLMRYTAFIIENRMYALFGAVVIVCITSVLFYTKANSYPDVDSHIPATILAQQYGYDLEGYGLSFVFAKDIEDTYGNGTLRILYEGIKPDSFGHYRSTIGIQGFFYAWLYQAFSFESINPLYMFNTFLSALCVFVCAFLLGKIFCKAFGIIFFISFVSGWTLKLGGSLYFSLAFWLFPAIIAFSLYIAIAHNKLSKMMFSLLCLAYMLAIALRASMSYEFITSIILFSLSPFIISFIYGLLSRTESTPPFVSIAQGRAFEYGLGFLILACVGFMVVFIIHTYIRGNGDLYIGFMDIYQHDFLRRMIGGDSKEFDPVYANSLNASALDVITIYITTGTKLFLILFWISVFVCFVETNKVYRSFYIALIVCFALPALSWFIFGKSHSFIHRHFCFILWYLGFWASIWYVPLHYFYRKKIA